MFHKHRLEALSDAVIAIAMTLLILEIKAPTGTAPGELGAALAKDGHAWISFAITFFLTAVFWVWQHRVFDELTQTPIESVALTFVFLGFITILPFTTSLWGHHLSEPLADQIYFANQLALAVSLMAKLEIAHWRGYLIEDRESLFLRRRLYSMSLVFVVAILATPFEPPKQIWVAPFIVAVLSRTLLRVLERRAAKNRPAATA